MKKKRIIATASAIALVVILLLGGTMAYLYDESEEVVNTISPNYNSVTLKESDVDGDENEYSNTYDIVPGTSDTKDPVATVNYTLDSYVYIVMDEDASTLVEFSIDTSVWTQLDGYDNVWYALVTADNADGSTEASGNENVTVYTKDLNVLTDKIISYSSTLTNDDMTTTDSNGETVLIDDVTIEFQAYIIQADVSGSDGENDTVLDCWLILAGQEGLGVAAINGQLYDTLAAAIEDMENGETVILLTDLTLSTSAYTYTNTVEDSEYTIDLNGYTMTTVASFTLKSSDYVASSITIKNGTVNNTSTSSIRLESGTTAVFEDVTFANSSSTSSRVQSAVQYYLKDEDATNSISFDGCTFDNTYVEVSSSSGTYEVDISVTDCTFNNLVYASGYGGSAITLGYNITPNLTVENCSFTAVSNQSNCAFIKIPTTSGHGDGTITVKGCDFDLTASGASNTCIQTGSYFKGTESVENCTFKVTAKSGSTISAISANTNSSAKGKMTLNLTDVTIEGISDGVAFRYPVYIMQSNYVTVNESGINAYTIDGTAVAYSGGTLN